MAGRPFPASAKSGHIVGRKIGSHARIHALGLFRPSDRGKPRRPRHDHRPDALVLLSGRGETAELAKHADLRPSASKCRSSRSPRPETRLHAIPRSPSCCARCRRPSHGLAPTTSAMLQLAVGDALAIALLERRGFSAEDFKTFHPGGNAGAQFAPGSGAGAWHRAIRCSP